MNCLTSYSPGSEDRFLLPLRENTLVAGHARETNACCSLSALASIFSAPLKDVLFVGLRLCMGKATAALAL